MRFFINIKCMTYLYPLCKIKCLLNLESKHFHFNLIFKLNQRVTNFKKMYNKQNYIVKKSR